MFRKGVVGLYPRVWSRACPRSFLSKKNISSPMMTAFVPTRDQREYTSVVGGPPTGDDPIERTSLCGKITEAHDNQTISVWGWLDSVRPAGSQLVFGTLKDYSGRLQFVCEEPVTSPDLPDLRAWQDLPEESVLWLQGQIRRRPEGAVNPEQGATGLYELVVRQVKVLNEAQYPLPTDRFTSRQRKERAAKEDENLVEMERTKLQHRVLYLRSFDMQRTLRLRAQAYREIRSCLDEAGFLEVETPTLFKRTSEGAREFIVPSSSNPGKFYALVQSPQQYKQLLMAGGIDRYYQIARCYRDEALRADRQPEFTQLDMEMSCTHLQQVYELMETLLSRIWKSVRDIDLPRPFPQMSYHDALSRFGSDKPDTRFGFEIQDVSDACRQEDGSATLKVFHDGLASKEGAVLALNMKGLGGVITSSELKHLPVYAASLAASGLVPIVVTDKKDPKGDGYLWKSPLTKALDSVPVTKEKLTQRLQAEPGDLILLNCEQDLFLGRTVMGKMRLHAASLMQRHGIMSLDPNEFKFLWVTRFPLLARVENSKEVLWECSHHPFTAPVAEDVPLLSTHPEQVRGQHYDCVVNGVELGGGSIRIHNADLQLQIFRDILRLSEKQINEFQHLIEALRLGCPPHGGIAFGLDRMCALLAGTSSIRDVIAFPKAHSGRELLTGTPTVLPPDDLQTYSLQSTAPTSTPKEE